MNYEKHNLYIGAYHRGYRSTSFTPPPSSKWIVRRLLGEDDDAGHFTVKPEGPEAGRLVLILDDGPNSFWPVMSFLDDEEAAALALELTKAVGYALSQTTATRYRRRHECPTTGRR